MGVGAALRRLQREIVPVMRSNQLHRKDARRLAAIERLKASIAHPKPKDEPKAAKEVRLANTRAKLGQS